MASSNTASSQLIDRSSASLHQQINDLAVTLNTSIEQNQVITNASLDVLHQLIDDLFRFHPTSCATILLFNSSSPSGYYSITSSNGSAVRVYCDMTLSCGNITGGWMRVAELDMTDNNTQCPSTLTQRIDSNRRTCAINSNSASRAPVNYSIDPAIEYSKVCGKIKAYQIGSPDAFCSRSNTRSIDSNYVDGISLTYGSQPRKHIWTFVGSLDEVDTNPRDICPCTNINQASRASNSSAFVGNDYFCDTGSQDQFQNDVFYDDPLWDGAGCGMLYL